jgi:peptidyl-tRNA hydrolase
VTDHVPDAAVSTATWAMQLVLRDERTGRAGHLAACEAAAIAVVRLLDDDRSAPGGPWREQVATWDGGPIRKVVRRARGARFQATAALGGIEVLHRGAQVRAFVPAPIDQVPPDLARLQVGGTDLPDVGEPAPSVPGGLVVVLTPLARLSTGKAAAQCGHAAHLAWRTLGDDELEAWRATGFAVRALAPDVTGWRQAHRPARVRVADGGFTEVAPGTVTALAWPETRGDHDCRPGAG